MNQKVVLTWPVVRDLTLWSETLIPKQLYQKKNRGVVMSYFLNFDIGRNLGNLAMGHPRPFSPSSFQVHSRFELSDSVRLQTVSDKVR